MTGVVKMRSVQTPEESILAAIEKAQRELCYRRPAVRAALEVAKLMVSHPTKSDRPMGVAVAIGEKTATVLRSAAQGQTDMVSRQLLMASATAGFHCQVSVRPDGEHGGLLVSATNC